MLKPPPVNTNFEIEIPSGRHSDAPPPSPYNKHGWLNESNPIFLFITGEPTLTTLCPSVFPSVYSWSIVKKIDCIILFIGIFVKLIKSRRYLFLNAIFSENNQFLSPFSYTTFVVNFLLYGYTCPCFNNHPLKLLYLTSFWERVRAGGRGCRGRRWKKRTKIIVNCMNGWGGGWGNVWNGGNW